MVYYNTVKPEMRQLLDRLMGDSFLSDFVLIGGTNLSLRLGHRLSVDLDLSSVFMGTSLTIGELSGHLSSKYNYQAMRTTGNYVSGFSNGIKLDWVTGDKKNAVMPFEIRDNIRLASIEDVAAMKMKPILDERNEMKDFFDVATLSSNYSLNKMIGFYSLRYKEDTVDLVLKLSNVPKQINGEVILPDGSRASWPKTRQRVLDMVKEPEKIFAPIQYRALPYA